MTATRRQWTHGPRRLPDGAWQFRLWAPGQSSVRLALDDADPTPMTAADGGWFELTSTGLRPGALYRFVLEDGLQVPDPASRFQPQGVHGPSQLVETPEER